MIVAIKIILTLTLSIIGYQDIKDQLVWWFLFPLYALLGALLFYSATYPIIFLTMIGINISLLLIYLGLLYLLLKFAFNTKSVKDSIGLGDVLLFGALATSFPPITFILLLIISALISFVFGKFLKSTKESKTIPYAGYTSLFLIGIYIANWSGLYKNLYIV